MRQALVRPPTLERVENCLLTVSRCYHQRFILSRQGFGYRGCKHPILQRAFDPDKQQNPPLYLHVTSTSKSGLEKAIAKIEELMKQELPNLIDERRFRRRDQDTVERDEFGRVSSTFQITRSQH